MKYLATMALALVPLTSMATDLTIPAGQAYLVGVDQQELILDKLRIGDGARISFAPGVNTWRVHARLASIGKNVVIDGRGTPGQHGTSAFILAGSANAAFINAMASLGCSVLLPLPYISTAIAV